ncbi:hypothetical protein C8D92_101433 [Tamilnaduibacter salinus]|uniref:Uncharacterized protein n=1 Tax=Tamilnaduibacter salinus TaxID=1484056 RepID=A0A2U1D1F4_9GAMM|nr:hypothetical protein [Tamilnaduibacter salinus]PVY79223.1 hypothetical protein C8D92_101433 [Tamilnaduibacter salinus]
MEPIRPEHDELRAERRPEEPAPKKRRKVKQSSPKGGGGGRDGVSTGVLSVLLIIVTTAAGVGWYHLTGRLQALESEVTEADQWVRQSKLALARFEGQLSETGENLQQKGSSLSDRIARLEERADTADSEIRKLWGVAYDRNREAIKALEANLGEAEEGLSSVRDALAGLREDGQARSGRLDAQSDQLAAIEQDAGKLSNAVSDLEARLPELEKTVTDRIDGLRQEARLARQELSARVDRVASNASDSGELASVRQRLGEVEEAIDAIDAARAQLNSRLIRIQNELDSLKSGA